MANELFPVKSSLGERVPITLEKSCLRGYLDKLDVYNDITALLNNTIVHSKYRLGGALLTTTYPNYIEFSISRRSVFWARGDCKHSDSGGATGSYMKIEKHNGRFYEDFIVSFKTNNSGNWYIITDNLPPGKYRITAISNYVSFDKFYFEELQYMLGIIKSDEEFFTIKSDILANIPLSIPYSASVFKLQGFSDIKLLSKLLNKKSYEANYIKDVHQGKIYSNKVNQKNIIKIKYKEPQYDNI